MNMKANKIIEELNRLDADYDKSLEKARSEGNYSIVPTPVSYSSEIGMYLEEDIEEY